MNIWIDRDWGPMLLKEVDKPFNSDDYVFELKFDGIRAIIFANNNEIKIQSRNKQDITHLFPELKDITKLVDKNVIFDGEIVAFDNNTYSFSKIQERLHIKSKDKIANAVINNPVTFIAFDILYEDKDLTNYPLLERKNFLKNYKDNEYFVKTKMINKLGIELFKSVKKMNLEGIVAKLKNGKYYINKRTDEFIKIKNLKRDEFIIGGYEKKKNNIISLALGEYIDNKFHFVGKASISKKYSVYNKIKSIKKSKNYFCNFNEDINYIKPTISCHVEYLQRTKNNHLRHPIIKDI